METRKLSLDEMANFEAGRKKPCWLAASLFLASGIVGATACVVSGGLACAASVLAAGSLYWDYLDSCWPV